MADFPLNQPVLQPQERTVVSLNQNTIFITLAALSVAFVLVSFVGVVLINPYSGNPYAGDPADSTPTNLAKLVLRLDVIAEGSIPTWYSGAILLVSAILLLVIAINKRAHHTRFHFQWLLLSVMFFAFSLDEIAYLHEGISNMMTRQGIGILQLGWTIPAAILVLLTGLWFAKFVLHLPAQIRRLVIIAAALFLTGALALEIVERLLLDAYSLQTFIILTLNHLQDLFEMLGVSVFIYALLSYIRNHMSPIQLIVR